MKKSTYEIKLNNVKFNYDEEKLLKKYIEEYNDLYPKILILSPNEFIQNLKKMILISLKEKFNGFSKEIQSKIEEFIIDKIYCHDYKYTLFAKKNILNKRIKPYFNLNDNEEIIAHCSNCKKNGFYMHSCGNKFLIYKYKSLNLTTDIKCLNNFMSIKYLLYCSNCDMIYKNDLIKFKCNATKENFYSKISDKNENDNNKYATFKKYHCNIIINDAIKCQKCNENLYYQSEKKIYCKNCKKEFDADKLLWKCIKCKKNFTAEIKVYNPLEYKNMKICVKEGILNKKKAKPEYMGCNCKIDNINKINFFHKNNCKGKLYIWELNEKKVVICEECESLGMYDNYTWTCPLCFKRFKNNTKENNNQIIKENKDNKEPIMNKYFNHSKSNFYNNNEKSNIKINNFNNNGIYISPNKLKNKYSFNQQRNETIEKKDNNKNSRMKILRRVNSAAKLNINNNMIPSPKKENKIINNVQLIENKENKTPNITTINNESNAKYNKRNRLISNIDINDVKKLNNIFNKYVDGSSKKDIKEKKNKYSVSPKKLESNNSNNKYKYKRNVIDNSSKIINKTPLKKLKRSYSSYVNDNKLNKINNINIIKNKEKNENSKTPSKINNKIPNSNNKINNIKNLNKSPEKKKLCPGKFNINNYKIKRQIGEGSFGQIFLVEDKDRNQYALKKIIGDSSEDINSLKQEYQILIDIQNNNSNINVVNILGISNYKLDMTTHVLYVLMELANTDWEKEILKRKNLKKYYEENELMNILYILIKSLALLQKQNISHRDIKPQNILVFYKDKDKKEAIYKLADFGEAKELYKGDKPTNRQTLRGTELYMSPILFYALRASHIMKYVKHNTYKSDVFSFGLCALFAASLCFESLYDVRELKNNVSLKIVVNRYLRTRYSYKVIDFISKMLDINEATRLDFIQLQNELENLGYK